MKRIKINSKIENILHIGLPIVIFVFLGVIILDRTSPTNSKSTITLTPEQLAEFSQSISDKSPGDISELKIEDTQVGTGAAVKDGDVVTVNYIGTLVDGTQFDSSYDRNEPFSFAVGEGQVIAGWDQGIIGMQVGGKRTLSIPSSLGYGESGSGDIIPPNAGLIFEIELVSIENQ